MSTLSGMKVLVSEPLPYAYEAAKRLEELGASVDFGPAIAFRNDARTTEEMKTIVQEYDGFIGMSREKFPREVLECATRLRIIGKYGVGVDSIDLAAATENDVLIAISPVNRISVAEHTVMLALTLLKNTRKSQRYLNEANWRTQELIGHEINGKTVGFLGIGGITREVAARLVGWNCSFIGYDPYVDKDAAAQIGIKKVEWEELFRQADIISLHLPLTSETRGIVGEKEFSIMKKSAIFINTARGPLVDQAALIRAVKSGEIAGCGLDVMQKEDPIPIDDPIMEIVNYDNVILTPHTAGWCAETQQRWCDMTTDCVLTALQGEIPPYIANRDVIERWKKKYSV